MLTKFSAGMLAAVFTAGTPMLVWVAEASPGLIEAKANETVALGTGICWRGGALDGWRAACDCRRAAFRDGVLSIDTTGRDGQIVAEFKSAWTADVRDVVVIRARTAFAGHGDLFWIPEGGQESARYNAKFEWRSTGTEWCEYRVRPFWQGSPKIATLRIDFPPDASEGTRYEFAEIRVERDKSLPVLDLDAAKVRAAVVTLAADRPNNAEFCWAVSDCDGVEKAKFRFPGDGRIHRHVIRLSALRKFRGRVVWAGIRDSQGAEIPDAKIEFSETPVELPGDLSFADLQVDTTLPRAGRPVPVCSYLKNLGDRPVTGVDSTCCRPWGSGRSTTRPNPVRCTRRSTSRRFTSPAGTRRRSGGASGRSCPSESRRSAGSTSRMSRASTGRSSGMPRTASRRSGPAGSRAERLMDAIDMTTGSRACARRATANTSDGA